MHPPVRKVRAAPETLSDGPEPLRTEPVTGPRPLNSHVLLDQATGVLSARTELDVSGRSSSSGSPTDAELVTAAGQRTRS